MSNELNQVAELIKENKDEEAKAILWQILKKNAGNDQAWVWLASITADREERKGYLEEALKHNPSNQTAVKAMQKMSGGKFTMETKNVSMWGHMLCGWPMILVFLGGFIGGAMGGLAYGINLTVYKSQLPQPVKFILIMVIGGVAIVAYFVISLMALQALRG